MDEQIKSNRTQYESTLSSQQKELLRAVEIGSLPEVKQLFNGLSKLEKQKKSFDYVLLTTAVEKRQESVIQFLLESNCRVTTNTKTQFLCTPLYYATEQNDDRIANDLLMKGASICDKDVNEKTPLEFAIQNERFELVKVILLSHDSIDSLSDSLKSLDPKGRSGVALFHMVCYHCKSQDIKKFLDLGFSVHSRSTFSKDEWKGFTPLHFILASPYTFTHEESVELLLKHNADILAQDEKGMTAVHIAIRNKEYRGSSSPFHQKFLNKWISCLIDTKFSNVKDLNELSHFHILCCGSDDRHKTSTYIDAIQSFLDNGVDINSSISSDDLDFPEYTALHFAVKYFRSGIIKLLLKNGADIKKTDAKGRTPLHVACDYLTMPSKTSWAREPIIKIQYQLEIANLLLHHGADVDAKDLEGGTPLHYSFYTKEERRPLANLLLAKSQLSSDLIDRNGLSYLHIASSLNLSAVETLINGGASVHSCVNSDVPWATLSESGYCALHFAVSYNKPRIVQYLLDHGADINFRVDNRNKDAPIHIASRCEITQLKDMMMDGDTLGAIQSHVSDRNSIIRSLIEHGATVDDRDSFGRTPLLIACQIPDGFEIMDLDPSPNNSDSENENSDSSGHHLFENRNKRLGPTSDIVKEIYDGQRSTIEILLGLGADVHARDNGDSTVLHEITNRGYHRQQKVLSEIMLEKGVDVNASCDSGTPLHYVVHNYLNKPTENMSLLSLYFKYGADINANNGCCGTPLHMIASDEDFDELEYDSQHRKLIRYLTNHPEIDLDALDKKGRTPLHIAVEERTHDLRTFSWSDDSSIPKLKNFISVEILLGAGADILVEDSKGSSPLKQLYKWLVNNFSKHSKSRYPHRHYLRIFVSFIAHLKKLLLMKVSNSDEIKEKINKLSQLRPEVAEVVDSVINAEVNKLKSTVVDSYTSLFDILSKDSTDMAKHVKNGNLKKIMEANRFCVNFLMFHNLLIRQFKRGLMRNSVLESAKNALDYVSRIDWPSSCSENILRYLDTKNLTNLIESVSAVKLNKKSAQNLSVHKQLYPKIWHHESVSHWIEDLEMHIILIMKKKSQSENVYYM